MRRPATPRQRRTWRLRRGVVLAVSPCIPVWYSPVYLYIVYCIPWYTHVCCIAGYTRITLCGILWYSVVVWSSRFPSAPTPLIISPPSPHWHRLHQKITTQWRKDSWLSFGSIIFNITIWSPGCHSSSGHIHAILQYWYDIKHTTQMTRYLSRYAYPNSDKSWHTVVVARQHCRLTICRLVEFVKSK